MENIKEIVDISIFVILGAMGFIALWFSIERYIFLTRFKPEQYKTHPEAETALTNNMTSIFIIYSNAPYVGLLGTVLGIMITFYDMGQSGGLNAKDIMIGMSLALKATALGLVVAIPALMAYNGLNRKIITTVSKFKEQ